MDADMTIKGGCLCGAVTYEITGEPMFAGQCACENCQKSSGTGHSAVAAYPEPQVQAHGAVTSYVTKGDSGQPATYQFCPVCGSRLFLRAAVMPNVVMVSLGTMQAGSEPTPSMFIYGKRRRSWDAVDASMQLFDGMPSPG
jgi:hypothetical protein